jgi:uncharacterized protein
MEKIGVVSDTHGMFDAKLTRMFEGVSLILHAGDVGANDVLTRLSEIAPVRAIAGNNDTGPWASQLPAARVEKISGLSVLIVHALGSARDPELKARFLLEAEHPRIVVSGHSHTGGLEVHEGRLYVNPGGAGKKRFKLIRSAALLEVGKTQVKASLRSLESGDMDLLQQAVLEL